MNSNGDDGHSDDDNDDEDDDVLEAVGVCGCPNTGKEYRPHGRG